MKMNAEESPSDPAYVTGIVRGKVVTLDDPVPPLDGRRVRVLLDPVEDPDERLTAEAQKILWQAWVEGGPQGPVIEEGEPEFP